MLFRVTADDGEVWYRRILYVDEYIHYEHTLFGEWSRLYCREDTFYEIEGMELVRGPQDA